MRIQGKGETWTISCSAAEVAMILDSLKNNPDLQLESALMEALSVEPGMFQLLFPKAPVEVK
jgi:hypothetical protein